MSPGGVTGGFLLRRLLGSAISNATGYALGTAISPTLVPFVQELENETWPRFQFKPLEAPDGLLAMLHKPAGYVCTHADGEGPTIYELVPARWLRPVGSEGQIGG